MADTPKSAASTTVKRRSRDVGDTDTDKAIGAVNKLLDVERFTVLRGEFPEAGVLAAAEDDEGFLSLYSVSAEGFCDEVLLDAPRMRFVIEACQRALAKAAEASR